MAEYIFYKISCIDKNIDYTYIGSTQNFRHRKWHHKSDCTNEASKAYNITLYKSIRENGGWENWSMVPIGKGIFEKKVDALIEEQKYITDNNASLNSYNAFTNKEDYDKQYFINNLEKVKDTQKKYRETHKEELIEKQKKYRDTHKEMINEKTICECGGCYTYGSKARHFKTKRHIAHFS